MVATSSSSSFAALAVAALTLISSEELIVSAAPLQPRGGSAAAASSPPAGGFSIPLNVKRAPRTAEQQLAWLGRQRDLLRSRYNVAGPAAASASSKKTKRASSATVVVDDINLDRTYTANITLGTPPTSYNVILDTGSSDLWLTSTGCQTGTVCPTVLNKFDPKGSSSFKDTQTPVTLPFGSGVGKGTIGSDTVSMGGFTVPNQTFVSITTLSAGLINSPVISGLMGLAFAELAATKTTPWWLNLVNSNAWSQPLFSMYLARFSNSKAATLNEAQGGSLDLGFMNTNFFQGDVSFVPLSSKGFWAIPMDNIIINGKTTSVAGTHAAIDSGTSLIGGPSTMMNAIYSQINGAQPGTGALEGYFVFPCVDINVSLTFGGKSYSILPSDFSFPTGDGVTCAGSFFPLDLNNGVTDWIVGDSFMKNVYTVFQQSPAQVGFATLKANPGPITPSSATSGSASAASGSSTASASASGSSASSSASGSGTAPSLPLPTNPGSVPSGASPSVVVVTAAVGATPSATGGNAPSTPSNAGLRNVALFGGNNGFSLGMAIVGCLVGAMVSL